jgi:flagellar basal-body rod protein FlgC
MSMLSSFRISASALTAERYRMDVVSTNLANANTMRINGVDPYRRRIVAQSSESDGTVRIQNTLTDMTPFRVSHEPGNPHADESGYVTYSNVEPISEMAAMLTASRAYEANLQAFNVTRSMLQSALEIGRI